MRLLWGVLSALVLVAGCKLNTDYFSDYRGKNILGNYDFNAVDSSSAPKWALASNGLTASQMSQYMTWQDAGQTGPDGTSRAYRLEIKNLIPNGDFEDTSTDTTWSTNLTSGSYQSTASSPQWRSVYKNAGSIAPTAPTYLAIPATPTYLGSSFANTSVTNPTGNGLGWSAANSNYQLQLDLTTAAASAWGLTNYVVRCELINETSGVTGFPITVFQGDGVTTVSAAADNNGNWAVTTKNSSNTPDYSDSFSLAKRIYPDGTSAEPRFLGFGYSSSSGVAASALIDNVRMLPGGLTLAVETAFASLNSGSLQLLSGSASGDYVFSVYVKDDPTVGLNRFAATALTVKLTADVKSGSRTGPSSPTVTRPAGGWTTWTKLTFSMGFDFVSTDPTDGSKVLVIDLYPTAGTDGSSGIPDVGSLLISEPTLTYNP